MNLRPTRTLWWAGFALAVVVALVACGFVLHARPWQSPAPKKHTSADDVRAAVTAYLAALADGDLDRLRAATCPGYHDGFFEEVDPARYKAVHDNESANGDVLELDSIDSVVLTPPTAQAEVTTRSKSAPQPQRLLFDLRQTDGQWQICEPKAPKTPSTSPR